jgi:hypothetical protein
VILALALGVRAAAHAAEWLVRPRPIGRCDLMVVLGGGARERVSTALDLMTDGACRVVMFTGNPPGAALDGLPPDLAVVRTLPSIPAPASSRTTLEDAVTALRGARAGGFDSLLIVTSPYHTRRADWAFSRVLSGTGVRFGIYPSDVYYMDYARWWESRDGIGVVLGEYAKLFLYGLGSEFLVGSAGRGL